MSEPFSSWQKIVRGAPNEKGWRNLEVVEGEEHRGEVIGEGFSPILSLIHLSDLHTVSYTHLTLPTKRIV